MRALALAAVALAAGCVTSTVPLDPSVALPDGWHLADLVEIDHDHTDLAAHRAIRGLELAAFANPIGESLRDSWIYDITPHEDLLFASVRGATSGVLVADTSRLPDLPLVSLWTSPSGEDLDVADVHVSADGAIAALATQAGTPGVWILDVSDPAAPVALTFTAIPPLGAHTVQIADLAGKRIVFAMPAGEQPNVGYMVDGAPFTNTPLNAVLVYELVELPSGFELRPLAHYQAESEPVGPAPAGTRWQFPHDVRVQKHPVTGQDLLYVAYWNAGLRIVDVTDPAAPREVGRNLELGPAEHLALHDVWPIDGLVDGRHYTLSSPELVTADEPGLLRVYDTTDPAAPALVGHWRFPQDPLPVANLQDTIHRLYYADGKILVAHRHYGFWVLDASTPGKLRAPVPLGFSQDYSPAAADGTVVGAGPGLIERPGFNDAMWKDGYAITNEWTTGFHVYRLAGT